MTIPACPPLPPELLQEVQDALAAGGDALARLRQSYQAIQRFERRAFLLWHWPPIGTGLVALVAVSGGLALAFPTWGRPLFGGCILLALVVIAAAFLLLKRCNRLVAAYWDAARLYQETTARLTKTNAHLKAHTNPPPKKNCNII